MDEQIFVRVLLVVVMGGTGALIVWMARAAASGRLRRNPFAGIRLPATMASDDAWLSAHRAAKRPTEAAGWIAIASAVPCLLPVPLPVVAGAILVGAAGMVAFTLYGASVGNRAAAAGERE